jgi:tRNA (cytidine/uridine-2'-O-)-methyltransferase
MFQIILYQPEIPPNTGNIIRLAANTGAKLHLIEPLGFTMEDKLMRRAGLDYHEYAQVQKYPNWDAFLNTQNPDRSRLFALSTRGSTYVHESRFEDGDWLLFGQETSGLPQHIREQFDHTHLLRLKMIDGQRSLNLSNTVAVVLYEAWRQQGFNGAV